MKRNLIPQPKKPRINASIQTDLLNSSKRRAERRGMSFTKHVCDLVQQDIETGQPSGVVLPGCSGIAGQIPLPREALCLHVMRMYYLQRHQIFKLSILSLTPNLICEALDIAESLLMAEQLLSQAGISTELDHIDRSLPLGSFGRSTFCEELAESLRGTTRLEEVFDKEMFQQISKHFHPASSATKATKR